MKKLLATIPGLLGSDPNKVMDKKKEASREYYYKNREKLLTAKKIYEHNHKKEISERHKKYYQKNLRERKKYNQEYRQIHKEELKEKQHLYYQANKEKVKKRVKDYYEKNKNIINLKSKAYRQKNKEKRSKQDKIRGLKRRIEIKKKVFDYYGNKCACCGEMITEFLCIDHINGGGSRHRRSLPSRNLYNWLIKNNFPPGFQTLCFNCNQAKGVYGKCPHQKIKENRNEVTPYDSRTIRQ